MCGRESSGTVLRRTWIRDLIRGGNCGRHRALGYRITDEKFGPGFGAEKIPKSSTAYFRDTCVVGVPGWKFGFSPRLVDAQKDWAALSTSYTPIPLWLSSAGSTAAREAEASRRFITFERPAKIFNRNGRQQ